MRIFDECVRMFSKMVNSRIDDRLDGMLCDFDWYKKEMTTEEKVKEINKRHLKLECRCKDCGSITEYTYYVLDRNKELLCGFKAIVNTSEMSLVITDEINNIKNNGGNVVNKFEYKIGDKVVVTRGGAVFSTYDRFMNANLNDETKPWAYDRPIADGTEGVINALKLDGSRLKAIVNTNEYSFIIGCDGLEIIKDRVEDSNVIKEGDKVRIIKNNSSMDAYDKYIGMTAKVNRIIDKKSDYPCLVIQVDGECREMFWRLDEVQKIEEKSVADTIGEHLGFGDKKEEKREKMTYLGGDLLKKGAIMLRDAEAKELRKVGVKLYSPIEDKSINDKSNISKEDNGKLAERIVKNDTKAILESDYIVIEPQENALGTMTELGQIKGMKDAGRLITKILEKYKNSENNSYYGLSSELEDLARKLDKKVYPHYEDIRRTDIEEVGDRRSWGVNQYVYGVCLDLTDGKGFYEWDEIVEEMKKEYKLEWHDEYVEMVKKALTESKNIVINNIIPSYSHVNINLRDLYNKSRFDSSTDFYKELYKINSHEMFDGEKFEEFVFVSVCLRDTLTMELDFKRGSLEN